MLRGYNISQTEKELSNFRELQDGVQVYELSEPVELIVKTKAPMKWKLVDRETGEEYIGNTPKDGEYHWSKINA